MERLGEALEVGVEWRGVGVGVTVVVVLAASVSRE